MTIHQQLANATMQIDSGDNRGAGFHFVFSTFLLFY